MRKLRLYRWTLGVLSAVALLASVGVTPAEAFSQAFFPTLNSGNRGTDVQAIQYLLRQRGYGIAADGIFGPATVSAVRDFQSTHGLANDGIVGPLTWGQLVITVSQGSTQQEAVRAVQVELNAKRSAGLAVDGIFGSATTSAVVSFQGHAGISQDGIVGPTTWRNLVWHYETPNFAPASLCDYNGGNGTAGNWGTAATVAQMEAAAANSYAGGNGAVAVGDISLEHGGDIAGHASHEVGMDVDIRPIRRDRAECSAGTTVNDSTYDHTATRNLVLAIRAAAPGHVKLIFFNDQALINEGLTQFLDGHDNHLHVRYCEPVHPDSRYVC